MGTPVRGHGQLTSGVCWAVPLGGDMVMYLQSPYSESSPQAGANALLSRDKDSETAVEGLRASAAALAAASKFRQLWVSYGQQFGDAGYWPSAVTVDVMDPAARRVIRVPGGSAARAFARRACAALPQYDVIIRNTRLVAGVAGAKTLELAVPVVPKAIQSDPRAWSWDTFASDSAAPRCSTAAYSLERLAARGPAPPEASHDGHLAVGAGETAMRVYFSHMDVIRLRGAARGEDVTLLRFFGAGCLRDVTHAHVFMSARFPARPVLEIRSPGCGFSSMGPLRRVAAPFAMHVEFNSDPFPHYGVWNGLGPSAYGCIFDGDMLMGDPEIFTVIRNKRSTFG